MPDARIRRRVVVSGRVQGVAFRHATRERATAGGVDGWIRNRRDGTVEAVLEGPQDAVERVLGFCRTGPPASRVERVEVEEEEPEGLRGFTVH